jgi:uncharacterized protein YecE (DUF72 family)
VIRVGTAGWSYEDWQGIVYPRPRPKGFHPLAYLLPFLGCVEVNSSFYAMPRPEHAERWVELVQERPDFRFLVKLHRDFTHGPPFRSPELRERAEAFLHGVEPLREAGKLGALLIQFPVSFVRGEVRGAGDRLDRLSETFRGLPLAVELRHRSWFVPGSLDDLRRRRMSLLSVDLPAAREHPPVRFEPTGPIGYLRLHGRNARNWFRRGAGRDERYDYLYTPDELDELAARARRLAGEHDETYVVTNNHFEGQAVANALEIRTRLEGSPVCAPPQLVERYPHLRTVTRTAGQQFLF